MGLHYYIVDSSDDMGLGYYCGIETLPLFTLDKSLKDVKRFEEIEDVERELAELRKLGFDYAISQER